MCNRRIDRRSAQTVGSCWCICGLALWDACCLPKQCCPPSPVWIIMKTKCPYIWGPAGPFAHQACFICPKHSQFGGSLNHSLQKDQMKIRASIKSSSCCSDRDSSSRYPWVFHNCQFSQFSSGKTKDFFSPYMIWQPESIVLVFLLSLPLQLHAT